MLRNGKVWRKLMVTLMLFNSLVVTTRGQTTSDEPAPTSSAVSSLGLAPAQASQLKTAIDARDYIAAEKLLLAEIERDPHSATAARQLAFVGTVYFLNQDYMNAAIAWKKSEAIAPLDPHLEFSLAMAYVRMAHPGWARDVLESLAAQNGKEALYPYWLGRLDYDGQQYDKAIQHFQHAVELDPRMARAYDNLGLCYYFQNKNELAVENYRKAIDLEKASAHPSAWPYLNLAITLQFLNQIAESESNLREAIRIDPNFAQAHFQLGTVLEQLQHPEEAIAEMREAARLNPLYAEPHMAMARIYHKLGQDSESREQVQIYLHLHPHSTP
jgi:tetratricopeptide (TPR) repeat protein